MFKICAFCVRSYEVANDCNFLLNKLKCNIVHKHVLEFGTCDQFDMHCDASVGLGYIDNLEKAFLSLINSMHYRLQNNGQICFFCKRYSGGWASGKCEIYHRKISKISCLGCGPIAECHYFEKRHSIVMRTNQLNKFMQFLKDGVRSCKIVKEKMK
jgi:hypothetical protein